MTSTGTARKNSTKIEHTHRSGASADSRPTPSSRPSTPASAIEIAAA